MWKCHKHVTGGEANGGHSLDMMRKDQTGQDRKIKRLPAGKGDRVAMQLPRAESKALKRDLVGVETGGMEGAGTKDEGGTMASNASGHGVCPRWCSNALGVHALRQTRPEDRDKYPRREGIGDDEKRTSRINDLTDPGEQRRPHGLHDRAQRKGSAVPGEAQDHGGRGEEGINEERGPEGTGEGETEGEGGNW